MLCSYSYNKYLGAEQIARLMEDVETDGSSSEHESHHSSDADEGTETVNIPAISIDIEEVDRFIGEPEFLRQLEASGFDSEENFSSGPESERTPSTSRGEYSISYRLLIVLEVGLGSRFWNLNSKQATGQV